MGVLSCDRRGCDNIMCDLYSPKYGYLCNECFNELLQAGVSVSKFMLSNKGEYFQEFVEDPYEEFKPR